MAHCLSYNNFNSAIWRTFNAAIWRTFNNLLSTKQLQQTSTISNPSTQSSYARVSTSTSALSNAVVTLSLVVLMPMPMPRRMPILQAARSSVSWGPGRQSNRNPWKVEWLWKSGSRSIRRSSMLELFRGRVFGPDYAYVRCRLSCGKKKHSVCTIEPVINGMEMDGRWIVSIRK